MDDDEEEDVQRNGYGADMLTETADDQMTSDNVYDEEDYYASSQNQYGQTGGQHG